MMASSIGLVVTAGITNTFVQMSQRIRQIEAKQQREIFYNYIRRHFKNEQACIATLDAKGGTGTPSQYYTPNVFYGDAAGTKDPDGDNINDHEWTIPKLLKADGTDELDFLRQKPSTDAAKKALEKKFWEKWGIEKFDSIMFIHDTTHGSHLRVHIWNIAPGGMPYPAGPYMIPLTVTTAAAASPAQGKKIATCALKPDTGNNQPYNMCGTEGWTHSNGGGFVGDNTVVDASVFVGPNARVCDEARVRGNARIEGTAIVYNTARVTGNNTTTPVRVYGDARVYDNARVYDQAQVYGNGHVGGNARVYENAKVYGTAYVYGAAKVYGTAQVYEHAHVKERAKVYGAAKVYGHAEVYGNAKVFGGRHPAGYRTAVYGNARVYGNAELDYLADVRGKVYGDAKIRIGNVNADSIVRGSAVIRGGGIAPSSYAWVRRSDFFSGRLPTAGGFIGLTGGILTTAPANDPTRPGRRTQAFTGATSR